MMRKKRGLTLVELTLTTILATAMLLGLMELAQVQNNVIRRLQHNTTALYLLESVKNSIELEFANGAGVHDIHVESFISLISNPDWKIELKPQAELNQVTISLFNAGGGRYRVIYQAEVKKK
jgi:hypothetical protein